MKKINIIPGIVILCILVMSGCEKEKDKTDLVTFEDFTLGQDGYWNGSDGSGGFTIGNLFFRNSYNPDYESWTGFLVSNHTDTVSAGFTNQYSAIAGAGAGGSEKYAVFTTYISDTIAFTVPERVTGISLCNNAYAYLSMLNGDDFSKKFGGETGDDPDWFMVGIQGINESGEVVNTAEIYLADFRFGDNSKDYISNVWNEIDLSDFGFVKKLVLSFSSSDTGMYGMNTPAYLCIDNIKGEKDE